MQPSEFHQFLLESANTRYRSMPWRDDTRPYYVLVSELMLQQTQVARVIPKFVEFIVRFPNEASLADANLADVIGLWQGLGYNRRAKYLHEAAKMIVTDFDGIFPREEKNLLKLPGVGKNTSGAILAYAFNEPVLFVETNIRTVYIHHFFEDRFDVDDKEIIALLDATLDREQPRRFYQNLMDYGSWLKANGVKNISSSKHYRKQSPLKGSIRQTRGAIIRQLRNRSMSIDTLKRVVAMDERFATALEALVAEGLITKHGKNVHLTK